MKLKANIPVFANVSQRYKCECIFITSKLYLCVIKPFSFSRMYKDSIYTGNSIKRVVKNSILGLDVYILLNFRLYNPFLTLYNKLKASISG